MLYYPYRNTLLLLILIITFTFNIQVHQYHHQLQDINSNCKEPTPKPPLCQLLQMPP